MPSETTAIEWCESTWNPVHGCHKISEGCQNCYAAEISQQYGHTPAPWTAENASANVKIQDHHLTWPDHKDPQRIFVNSMSDLFLPTDLLPDDYLHDIMDVIERNPQHAFIALTKHGSENGRLLEWDRWPDNLWMGVSVESKHREYRIDQLRETDAVTKWVSFEPLITEVRPDLDGIDWAVVGGESGPDDVRRPMDHAWARTIKDRARESGAAFFFKQSSGPRQGHEPALRLDDSPDAETETFHELPPLPVALAEARPDLAQQVKPWDNERLSDV